MPFEITLENVSLKEYENNISYEYQEFIPEMENTSFGRDVSHQYYYVGRMPTNGNFEAVLFNSVNYFGEEMQPTAVRITTFSKQGEIISSKIIAGQFSSQKVKTCKIENGMIEVEDIKRNWKYGIDKVPFDQNELVSTEITGKTKYSVDENGKIIEITKLEKIVADASH
jgi:hypothetical protein